MDVDYAAIQNDLCLLRKSTLPLDVFGSQAHGFRMHLPLSEDAIRQFESEHRVALPRDYRGLLIHVGNGGAGPYYGLFRLGEMDDSRADKPWAENDGFMGTLSRPFPHTSAWNDLEGEPPYDESKEGDEAWEVEYNRKMYTFEEKYWSQENVNGAIPICHLGCALRQWLVVTGPEAGNIWNDDRVDHKGLYPLRREDSQRVTFIQWYRSWLDEALRKLQKASRA